MAWLYAMMGHTENSVWDNPASLVVTSDLVLERGDRLYVFNPDRVSQSDSRDNAADYARISLRNTDGVRFVRTYAEKPVKIEHLLHAIEREFRCDDVRARQLVESLLTAGVLQTLLKPYPIGDPVANAVRSLEGIAPTLAADLTSIAASLSQLDAKPIGSREVHDYEPVVAFMKNLHPHDTVPLQVDTGSHIAGTLGRQVLRDVKEFANYSPAVVSRAGSPC